MNPSTANYPTSSYISPAPRMMVPAVPVPAPTAQRAYFDKPADRRLRPYILVGSLILACMGAGMIITTFVHYGTAGSLWGLLSGGCALAFASLFGMLAALTLRPLFTRLFSLVLGIALIGSIAALIVNAVFLGGYMDNRCDVNGVARFSETCEDIRQYHYITYSVFGVLTATWVPTLFVASCYLWRTTSVYRKQEIAAVQSAPLPYGSATA